jgi:putative ABC transport system permease protein
MSDSSPSFEGASVAAILAQRNREDREGAALGAIGAVVGTAATVAASRLIGGQVFGISAVEPTTFGMTAATLILVALSACLVPALRAVRIDAIRALRGE